jgi:hypothetical protein
LTVPTQAIYAIGGDCAQKWWKDGRFTTALNLQSRQQRERDNIAHLKAALKSIPVQQAWLIEHRDLARRASEVQSSLGKQMPTWRGLISRRLRERNLLLLGRWAASDNPPINFKAPRTTTSITIQIDGAAERWTGPVNFPAPKPLDF